MFIGTPRNSNWPAAAVAIGFLAFLGFVFLTIYYRDGIDTALKAWAALGTIIGIVTGAIPSYFFHKVAEKAEQSAEVAQRNTEALMLAADHQIIEKARQYGFRG